MRTLAMFALLSMLLAQPLQAQEAPQPTDDKPSIVIARSYNLHLGDVYEMFFAEFEGDFTVVKQLSGPKLPKRFKVLMLGDPHYLGTVEPRPSWKLLLYVVHSDEIGYSTGQRWAEVDSRLCLPDETINEFQMQQAFKRGHRNDEGELCVNSW